MKSDIASTEMSIVGQHLELCLRFIALWPNALYTRYIRCFWFINLMLVQICMYYYIFLNFNTTKEFDNIIYVIGAVVVFTSIFCKMILFWLNQRTFYEIVSIMDNDWRDSVANNWGVNIMKSNIYTIDLYFKWILRIHVVGTSCFCITYLYPLAVRSLLHEDYENFKARSVSNMIIRFPFDTVTSPMYELSLVFQVLDFFPIAILYCTLNSLILMPIIYVGGRIDIIRNTLKGISNGSDKISLVVLIGKIIKEHQRVNMFAEKTQSLFSYIALLQLFTTTLIICLLGFVIIRSIHSDIPIGTILRFISGYTVVNLEAFILCAAGEYLNNKSSSIADAAYDSLWYDMRTKESKLIFFIICRARKQLNITAAKFSILCYERFAMIVRASVSYMSVLHAVY